MPHKDTCPVSCNKKIEELKLWLKMSLDTLHDAIVTIADEPEEWFETFEDEIDTLEVNIDVI